MAPINDNATLSVKLDTSGKQADGAINTRPEKQVHNLKWGESNEPQSHLGRPLGSECSSEAPPPKEQASGHSSSDATPSFGWEKCARQSSFCFISDLEQAS
jgi:hypothetical protein